MKFCKKYVLSFSLLLASSPAVAGGHLEKALRLNAEVIKDKAAILRELQAAEMENPSAKVLRAEASFYFENGQWRDCIDTLKKLPAANDYSANRILALSYYFTAEFTEALHHFENIGGKAEKMNDDEVLFYFGATREKKNLFEEAADVYRKIKSPAFRPRAEKRMAELEKEIPRSLKDLPEEIRKLIKKAPAQKDHPQAGAAVLLERENYEVFGDSTAVTDITKAVKIFNDRGKQKFAEIHLGYDSTYEEVKVLDAYTVKPDGTVVEVSARNMRDVSKYLNFPLYSNARVRIISMPEVTPGCVIVYRARYRENKLPAHGRVLYRWGAEGSEPYVREEITIKLPKSMEPNIKTFRNGYFGKKVRLKPKIRKTKNEFIYRWEADEVPEIIPEDRMPPWCEITDGFRLSSFKSWDEIYGWWEKMLSDRMGVTHEIRKMAASLIDPGSPENTAAAIYGWVASQIRYVAVEYGEAGFRPHKADEIFTNKYGDCKDQAILLVTMLREAGIKAYPVLIGTRGTFPLEEDFPELVFNHAIAVCEIGGKKVFMDATAETTPFGDLPWGDQGRKVLVFYDGGWKIERIPVFGGGRNSVVKNMNIAVDNDNNITAQRNVFTGGIYDQGQRYWLKYTKPVKIKEQLEKKVNSITPGAQLMKEETSGAGGLDKPCVIKMKFKGENYLKEAGFFRILPQWGGISTQLVSKPSRKYPIKESFPSVIEIKNTLNLPENWSAEFIPPSIAEDNEWFSYSRKFTFSDGALSYDERTVSKGVPVAPEDYSKYRNIIISLDKETRNQAVFKSQY